MDIPHLYDAGELIAIDDDRRMRARRRIGLGKFPADATSRPSAAKPPKPQTPSAARPEPPPSSTPRPSS